MMSLEGSKLLLTFNHDNILEICFRMCLVCILPAELFKVLMNSNNEQTLALS